MAAPRSLDRRHPLPLWAQLCDDLTRRLEAGAFNDRFPSELELVAQYDVSRHTVRDALRRLREQGMVDSARGRGTWVRHEAIEQPLGALYSLFRAVQARGMEQRSEVRELGVRSDAEAARHLELPGDSPLVYLERLRLAAGEPLALDRSWLPLDIGEPLLDADFTHSALYDQMATRCGVRLTGGRERLRAVVPDPAQRQLLGIRSGGALFEIERTGCLRDRPVERRLSLVRGDRFSVVAEWSQRQGYHLDVAEALPDSTT
ncbi:MAG: GntR family transcriptional regulator [Streptomycetales bacterium]